ncbi:MAG: transglutaminase family protein [Planctomycetota bacterium]
MTIRVALHHRTSYRYDRAISLGPQVVRLKPAYHGRTPIQSYKLTVSPDQHFVNWQQDPFANPVARLVFEKPVHHLSISVDLIADMTVINPFAFFIDDSADSYPFEYDEESLRQLAPYLVPEPPTPKLMQWIETLPKSADRTIDFLVEANRLAEAEIDYNIRLEPGVQTPEETLTKRSGSCRDSAWMLVQAFRHLGLASRFVSGYLIQLAADQESLDGPSGPTDDFCDLHAWTEVYMPGAGWIGLDPTSGLLAGEGHIPLACTPMYSGAAPITGGHEPCEVEFEHEMSVTRVHEDPRVTKPYTPAVWSDILKAGDRIDRVLDEGDVRLTMGGEPTFVSIDDMDHPQWNTDAVGEDKRVLSNLLLQRLRNRSAPGSLMHYGQGKWYPGESLPRWALTCMWRRDGQPIWHDDQWLADEGKDYGYTHETAERFVKTLARELGVGARMSFPVHEDIFHYLWRENQLPVDVDPHDPKLKDPNERAMMMRAFTQGLGEPVGHVLPIRRAWWQARPGWISGRWPLRSDRLYLIPGDSPIGLRLPLDALPTSTASTAGFYTTPADPIAATGPLPRFEVGSDLPKGVEASVLRDGHGEAPDHRDRINQQVLDEEDDDHLPTSDDVVQTALCVECRYGRLHIFMPPTQRIEDYLDLIAAIEKTCRDLEVAVVIEGYLPPPDDRVEYFKITPDPGVIEVNTQPSKSWRDLVELTQRLYEEARLSRLGTEKFDLDGLHTGTGGGNHIVMGGKATADSPFLRRPHLLGSFIKFWNNHPSLSYLFSGKFIGPTSQAPRMDESRHDAAYEMEIALAQLPPVGVDVPPWIVDRLFRDLLVDLTGNTHRAEICIDKLFSPDSSTGRLGLVELRGFEMPPHSEMSLAQSLLIRAAVAAFWDRPYDRPLVHWGSRLHDLFLLPHFAWSDLCNLIGELKTYGIELCADWFAPHHEFRFPRIGEVTLDNMRLELRSAIEPWYVMGEEPGASGTTRFVDSSLERLQVSVENFDPRCHAVTVFGHEVPMHATEQAGRYVAGVRYRAWQPPRCLHPTIGIHTPLQLDVVDRAAGHSIGGCTYHAVHPGGVGSDQFPVNAKEAESRRAGRFDRRTMHGGPIVVPSLPPRSGAAPYPMTMDLRRLS